MPNKRKSKGRGEKGRGRGRGNGGQETLPRPGRNEAGAAKHPDEKEDLDEEKPEEASCVVPKTQADPDHADADEKPVSISGNSRQQNEKLSREEKPEKKIQSQLQQPEQENPELKQTSNPKAKTPSKTVENKTKQQREEAASRGKTPSPPGQAATAYANDRQVEQGVDKVAAKLGSSLSMKDHTAHQAEGNGGLRPPRRPDHGTVGRPIKLRANFFRLNISPKLTDLYHYDVEITPGKCPKSVKRDVVNEIVRRFKDSTFQGHEPAFDGEKNLYSRIKLPPAELSVKLAGEDGGRDRDFKVKIQCAGAVSLVELKNFLMGKNGRNAQDTVQALDIVLRQIPSCTYTPVGRSFFPMNGHGRPIGEGCEVQFGFYQSVRPSEWKVMLVNIDVSAKGFYKSQDVIDFLCETLEVSPRQLEDPRARIDNFRKFESAIRGIRIETTHVASMKRKYTVWGVSSSPADGLQFDIEDEATGRKTKTTVAQYFKDRYRLPLRFSHLPCLQVGQKKDRYLPMEVCTIIPCQKRHLSEQQTANMIRSTARPAPERQRDIEHWAREMVKTSSKYLKKEFDTSVDQEMVSVDGRVLPAPRIKLGPQDQALVPRDGSWDMRNKALYEGARIDVWALACFAPPQRCNEDTLRKFSKQMSIVSNGEGMKMAAQPAVVRYARNSREVERLFSDWMVQVRGLQLIMVVLPVKDKDLYSEVKRVGDSVVGIPTQCVQLKLVQQAKPQVCCNISLKINAKMGGVNHVIDSSLKPVFTEPTIVFGADVTHPSPTENGIPSIAAVVASMDRHATKYQARVKAQKHVKGAGAQEIINDLAAIVRELLIEFYKANGKLKPSKIIFYRDGVSEGQFDQVLVHEVRAVQEACMKLEKGYQPGITFVVVQKRHHTRLFCENPADSSGRGENVPPGTTVDSGITHPYEFDFYLCSHYGIQGTSRPTHYHVLYDDNRFTADSLQQLTYQLCHVYARCTRSVSMPAPAYYAHLAAFHARVHVTNGGHGSDAINLTRCQQVIQVNDKMKGVMYFT